MAVTTDILHDLQGIEPEQRASAAKWNDGPKFVWRNLAAPRASDDTKSNPVSRAWKRTAAWLNAAATAKDSQKQAAIWKLLFYDHQLQVNDARLTSDAVAFTRWRQCLSWSALQNNTWVQAFRKVATTEASAAELKAGRLAAEKFTSWISEGPANGLKRQHMFARCATGWVQIGRAHV